MRFAIPAAYGLGSFAVLAIYPEQMKWVAFAAVVAIALLDMQWTKPDRIDWLMLACVGWGAVSLAWTYAFDVGLQFGIVSIAAVAWVYRLRQSDDPTFACVAMGIGGAASAAILTNAWLPNALWSGFGNSGYVAEAMTLSIPFLWVLWRREPWMAWGAILLCVPPLVYVIGYTPSMSEWLVIGVWVGIALALRRWWLGLVWLAPIGPAAVIGWNHPTIRDHLGTRLELWVNALFMVKDHPLFGVGAGSFVALYPTYKEHHGALFPFILRTFESYATEAEALHNDPLQLLVEQGTIGFGLFAALIFFALRMAWRNRRNAVSAAGGMALVTVLAESLIEYPLQRAGTCFMACVALGLATRR